MLERHFQIRFNKWLKYNWKQTAVFELKLVKGKSMPFSVVKEHQLAALRIAGSGLVYKIADDSQGTKPFDCFKIIKAPGYVVIMFYRRGQKEFVMIEVSNFIKEKEKSIRKSLTEKRAKDIADIICVLK